MMMNARRIGVLVWLGLVAIPVLSTARADVVWQNRIAQPASWNQTSSVTAAQESTFTFEAINDPEDASSWFQAFHLGSVQSFTNIGIVLFPTLGDDGTSGFESPGWDFTTIDGNPFNYSEVGTLPILTVAAGDATNDLYWRTHFLGDREGQAFILTLFASDDSGNYQAAAALWDGGSWDFLAPPALTWEEFVELGGIAGESMPVPGAAMLGLLGLGLVGGIRQRLR